MVEIGPNLLQAIIALVPITLAVIALIRQIWTDKRVAANTYKLQRHSDQIGLIKQQINGGQGQPSAPIEDQKGDY